MTGPLRLVSRTEYRAQVAGEMKESALQARVEGLARELGYVTYHTFDSRRSQPGFPDLVLVSARRGRLLVAELKTVRGRLSTAQTQWLAEFRGAGVEAHVWRPADLLDGTILTVLTRVQGPGDRT
ncbi:VRR-NUC domain-containing protein [Isoptericola variabilis]|uniref:VRR-NUC domain-containing protein n=1 Tax=Isoptericola variabilis TaxID=139208 RepID=UPI003D201B15